MKFTGYYDYKVDLEHLNILFISNSNDQLELLKKNHLNESDKIDGLFAYSIEEALETLQGNKIDCVVVASCEVAGESSTEILDKIREEFPEPPCIIFIDENYDSLANQGIIKSFDDFLLKEEVLENIQLLEDRITNAIMNRESSRVSKRILERITHGFIAVDNDDEFTYVNEEASMILQKSREELVGGDMWEEFPKIIGTAFQNKYDETKETQDPVYMEEYYPPLDSWLAITGYPSESGVTVYLRDITERKERERRLERRIAQQETTTDLLRMALEEGDAVSIQHAAVEKIADTLDNDFARIWKMDEEKGELVLSAQHRMQIPEIDESSLELDDRYQESFTFESRESIVIGDFYNESNFNRTRLMDFLDIRSGMSVLIGKYNDPWGVLSTYSRNAKEFSEDEVKFVEGIANMVAAVTKHQERHIKLREYKKAINAIKFGIYMIDSDQKIIMANKALQDLVGYGNRQLLRRDHDFLAQEDLENNGEQEIHLKKSNGEEIAVNAQSAPLTLPNGTKAQVVVVRDSRDTGSGSRKG